MSFLSIPAVAGATVYLRVFNLNSDLVAIDNGPVPPSRRAAAVNRAT
jgi:hypothetical protein